MPLPRARQCSQPPCSHSSAHQDDGGADGQRCLGGGGRCAHSQAQCLQGRWSQGSGVMARFGAVRQRPRPWGGGASRPATALGTLLKNSKAALRASSNHNTPMLQTMLLQAPPPALPTCADTASSTSTPRKLANRLGVGLRPVAGYTRQPKSALWHQRRWSDSGQGWAAPVRLAHACMQMMPHWHSREEGAHRQLCRQFGQQVGQHAVAVQGRKNACTSMCW